MKIFDDIRPEELESGFVTPEPGYEGFSLGINDKYPGDFPRYESPKVEEVTDTTSLEPSEEIIDANKIEGSIWENFDEQPADTQNQKEIQTQLKETEEQPIEKTPEEEIISVENIQIPDEPIPQEQPEIIPIVETQVQEPVSTDFPEEQPVLSVDEELKKLLEEELARSRQKKAQKESQLQQDQPVVEETTPPAKPDFVPVEESGEKVQFIDMMAIDPNAPKVSLDSDYLEPKEVIPEKKSKKKEKPPKEKPPKKEKTEKKSRKALVWILSAVAGLLIVFILSYFAFNYYIKHYSKVTQNDSLLAHKDTTHKVIKPKEELKTEVTHPKTLDTIKEIHKEPQKDTVQTPKTIESTKPSLAENKKEPKEPVYEPEIKQIPKEPIKPKPTIVDAVPPKPPKKTEKKQPIQPRKPKDVATIVVPPKEKEPELPKQTSVNPIYTIQVYATPSLEDAQFWMNKLLQMRISDVFISSQKIRDVVWYRVRFGKFTNKQQAIEVAKQFGFTQTWIDRIQ